MKKEHYELCSFSKYCMQYILIIITYYQTLFFVDRFEPNAVFHSNFLEMKNDWFFHITVGTPHFDTKGTRRVLDY